MFFEVLLTLVNDVCWSDQDHTTYSLFNSTVACSSTFPSLETKSISPDTLQHSIRAFKMAFDSNRMTSSIAIIGVGDVGAAAAYALILGNVAGEILLVDVKQTFRDGQILDLSDATYCGNSHTHLRAGSFKE